MTIDEAIIHAEEVAERQETNANSLENGDDFDKSLITNCLECAKEHRQLAEWLKELKAYREAEKEINRKMKSGQWSDIVKYGMGKALVIMRKHIMEVSIVEGSDSE